MAPFIYASQLAFQLIAIVIADRGFVSTLFAPNLQSKWRRNFGNAKIPSAEQKIHHHQQTVKCLHSVNLRSNCKACELMTPKLVISMRDFNGEYRFMISGDNTSHDEA